MFLAFLVPGWTGCCGALADGIEAGDMFIVTEAFCGEGASQYYTPGVKTVSASLDLQEVTSVESFEHIRLHTG
jgi:uridine phosphorylase